MERAVASHYNARPDVGTEQRKSSRIFHLKNFNNWVKAVLISRHVRRDDYVLDLCCGKGGDLLKWKTGRIKYLFAADIAEFSVDQAKTRYQSGNFPFNADFIACDCFSDDLLKHTRRQTFDIVNIQFALHYAFETEERATTAIRNIAKHLVSGGHFIGTIPNSNWIVKKLRDAPGLTFGNEIYSITFDQKDTWPIFGHQYRFALADAIDDCPEYLIHFPTLIKIAKKEGLELQYLTPFHKFYQQEWQQNLDLFERMRVCASDGSFPDQDWEAAGTLNHAGIYCTFAFQKR